MKATKEPIRVRITIELDQNEIDTLYEAIDACERVIVGTSRVNALKFLKAALRATPGVSVVS